MKQRSRLAAQAWKAPLLGKCPKTGAARPGHTACATSGVYVNHKGVEIVVKLVD